MIEVNWSSSSHESSRWEYVGTYNPEENRIYYSDGQRYTVLVSESGKTHERLEYDNASGYFYVENGKIRNFDTTDNSLENCIFGKS